MRFLNLILTVLLLFTTLAGDYIVFKSKFAESQLFRAFSDSFVHASIGCLSALTFFSYNLSIKTSLCVYNVIVCTILSSLIDVDHFIMARSFNLKDFTNLKRGLFHCTTFWILITLLLHAYSYYTRKLDLFLLNFMFIIAYSSHHIRDANRRGLWFYPFGHTNAINNFLYIFLICILPHVYVYIFVNFKISFKSISTSYSIV